MKNSTQLAAVASRTIPLARMTTLEIGGQATIVTIDNDTPFGEVVEHISEAMDSRRTPPVCLGWGSNVLAADQGSDAPVLHMATSGIKVIQSHNDTVLLTVRAGHVLHDLVDFTVAEKLMGLETMAGIPGTVGAMPIQNVGAYGQETADTLRHIVAWDWATGQRVRLSAADCALGHRTSRFKRSHRWTILEATFALRRSRTSAPIVYRELAEALGVDVGTQLPTADVIAGVLAIRRRKGMVLDPDDVDRRSVGSIFLSPVISPEQAVRLRERGAAPHVYSDGLTRIGASWLLREAGYTFGQELAPAVRISTKHLTLVTEPGARAADFARAAAAMRARAFEVSGVELAFEPDPIGSHDTSG